MNQFALSAPSMSNLVWKVADVAAVPLLITAQSTNRVSVVLRTALSVWVPDPVETTTLSDQPEGRNGVRFGWPEGITVKVLV